LGGGATWFQHGAVFAAAPWRGFLSNALNVSGAGVGLAVLPGSRMALFLPPHRGAVFKQRPQTVLRAGFEGVARFAHGTFLPPHRGAVF
jgi:hypothetical protein